MEASKTKADGTFELQPWFVPSGLLLTDKEMDVSAYKPGYFWAPPYQRENMFYLKKFLGDSKERNAYLRNLPDGTCSGPESKLLELNQALYQEAKDLAEPDKELVNRFRRRVERYATEDAKKVWSPQSNDTNY